MSNDRRLEQSPTNLGDLEYIFPTQVEAKKDLLEDAFLQLGEQKGLTVDQTYGNYPYPFLNFLIPTWARYSSWLISKKNGIVQAVINIHLGVDIDHNRYLIHTSTVKEGIAILPEVIQHLHPTTSIFRFTIPVPQMDYPDTQVQERLNHAGFEQDSESRTVAQMYWQSIDHFKFYTQITQGDTLIDPLGLQYYSEAEELFERNYDISSFHAKELRKKQHSGLVRNINSEEIEPNLIAVSGRTEIIPARRKIAIIRDTVVDTPFRNGKRGLFLASKQAEHIYNKGGEIIGIDAINTESQRGAAYLGAELLEWRRWYRARRRSNGALGE